VTIWRFFFLSICAFFFLIPSLLPAQRLELPPDGTPIAEVLVEGTDRLLPDAILRRMNMRPGDEFTRRAYRQDLQRISNIGTIDPLGLKILWKITDDGELVLTVQVKENPIITSIRIIGNEKFTSKQLLSQLDFEVGEMMTYDIEAATTRNLRSFYAKGGYKASVVNVRAQPTDGREDEAVDLYITVDEGARIKIKSVIYNGKKHFSRFFFKTRLMNAPGILFFDNYYDEVMIDDDLASIRSAYQASGYLDVVVELDELVYNEEKQEITIIYDITEGARYKISGVSTEGVTFFTDHEINNTVKNLVGRKFKGYRLAKAVANLRRLYGDQGYIDTKVGYRFEKDPVAEEVAITFTMREAPVVYVGEVRVDLEDYRYDIELNAFERFMEKFAPPTEMETINREVMLKTGEKYRTANEVRTVERLRNLGIFKNVRPIREPTADPQVRDVTLAIEEDPAAAFVGVMAGVGEESGPAITVRFEQPNARGRADKFSTSVTLGTDSYGALIRYYDRYVGDSLTSLDYRLYYRQTSFNAYDERKVGASVEAGRPLSDDDRWRGYMRFRLEHIKYSDYDNGADYNFDSYVVAAVRPMVVYDRRDGNSFPTSGYLVSGGFETGAADGFLFKMLHGFEWYKKPFDKSDVVYAYEHTVGLMPYDSDQVGLSERFFVGGTNSLRGFKAREVGDRDKGDNDLVTGGSTRITQRHELRFPIKDEFLHGRFFTDAAILEGGFMELGQPRIGSGVGAMIDFGAIKAEIDFALPVLKESDDETQFFHLKLGSQF
jgi:outer membrane protein insertion porin family